MGLNSRRLKERAAEYEDEYNSTMVYELNEILADYLDGCDVDDISAMEMHDIVEEWHSKLPEVWDWCYDMANSDLEAYEDARYEEMRDGR